LIFDKCIIPQFCEYSAIITITITLTADVVLIVALSQLPRFNPIQSFFVSFGAISVSISQRTDWSQIVYVHSVAHNPIDWLKA
jgi:hypothetical protein